MKGRDVPLDKDALIDRRVFRTTVIIIATAAAAYGLWKLADLLLLVFACALIALIFFNLARWIVDRTGLNFGLALALSVVAILATLTGAFWFFGNSLSGEFADLAQRLPQAWEVFRARFAETPVGAEIFRRAGDLVPSSQTVVGLATGLLTSRAPTPASASSHPCHKGAAGPRGRCPRRLQSRVPTQSSRGWSADRSPNRQLSGCWVRGHPHAGK